MGHKLECCNFNIIPFYLLWSHLKYQIIFSSFSGHSNPISPNEVLRPTTQHPKEHSLKHNFHALSNISKPKHLAQTWEKELISQTESSKLSSKMISADSYLPHSTSVVSTPSIVNHRHSNKLTMNIPDSNLTLAAMTMGSTSNSDSLPPPPPSYSRLPPDGHEFPPDYKDPSSTGNSAVFRVCFIVIY